MNYIVVFSLVAVLLFSMVNNVQADENLEKVEIKIDRQRNLDNVETATFGLG